MNAFEIFFAICTFIVLLSYLLVRFSDRVQCIFFGHDAVYVGKKSGMVFNEGWRGVTGSMRDIHCCGRCGKNLDH